MTYRLIFVHLLNDFSGSPRVLKEVIGAVASTAGNAKLYIGSAGYGVLSTCPVMICRFCYHRSSRRLITLFTYFYSQIVLFCKLLLDRTIEKDALMYVNTLLPFGAALYGKLTGRKVIYHVHEISIAPLPLKFILTGIARLTSSLNLYVSDAHMQALPIAGVPAIRIHNSLDADFSSLASASVYSHIRDGFFNVLMVASLRDYKGVPELVALADDVKCHTKIRFTLVVNDEQSAIDRYFTDKPIPANLTVHPRTSDVTGFYGSASLVLNLSRKDQWVETFGMTILEAMAYGIPVIVPPVGGPVELVTDGLHGFLVDSRDRMQLRDRVVQLYMDDELCLRMSRAGRERAAEFSSQAFAHNILAAIAQTRSVIL